jgi:octanoyl-[GcvH]:protein N-octanoyltransferase
VRSPSAAGPSRLALVRHPGSGRSALDVAVAVALLARVSGGEAPSTLRFYRPGPTLAFGRLDALRPGYAAAARAARAHSFEPVLRGPGGQAVAYHGGSVVLDLVVADADPITGVQDRFADLAELLAGALRSLGVDARTGQVPGEFCRGAHSVNAGGRTKLVGTAQRIVRGGFLFAASIVVREPEPVRAVLTDVYEHLGIEWDPATAGAVSDSVPGVAPDAVEAAVAGAFRERYELEAADIDAATLAAARGREHLHAAP